MNQIATFRDPTAAEVEIEQSVLGLLLCGADTAWVVIDRVDPDDLLEPLHQRILAGAKRVLDAGGEPNPLTLAAAMASDAGLEQMGGPDYFRHILSRYGRNRDIAEDICAALADQAQRRALRFELAETESRLADMSRPAREILSEHEGAISALAEGKAQPDDPVSLYEAARIVCDRLESPKETRAPLIGFGVAGLDAEYGGMAKGDLVFIAGRTGMGKTAVAIAIADHVAEHGYGVFMSSLEMKNDQLAERWLSYRAFKRDVKVPYNLIRLNKVHDRGLDVLAEETSRIGDMPFFIDHRRSQTIEQIATRARRMQAKLKRQGKSLGLIIIDHMQRIRPDGHYRGNKTAETTEIARGLKNVAGTLDVPILCLSQLNRAVESRDDKKPILSDLRESGAIEEEADMVLMLHRPEYYASKGRREAEAQGLAALTKWESALAQAEGYMLIDAAKVRHGEPKEIRALCDIKYNWIAEK